MRDALIRAAAEGDTGYLTMDDYPVAMAEFARDRWGWAPDPARMRVVPDVMQGVVAVLDLVTEPGDTVVVNSPVYPPFYGFVTAAHRQVVESPLTAEGRIDLDLLERTFTAAPPRTTYLLCSPHNPTGVVHTRAELTRVAALAQEHRVRVVVDEIHAPLVYAGATHLPYLSLPGTDDAFALLSASKAWNLAGTKAALAVAGGAAAADLHRMPEGVSYGAAHLGVLAHVAALRDGRDWLDALLDGLDENRALLGDLLREHLPDVGYRPPAGTYLAWLDCRALGLGPDPAARFLERGRVALHSGPAFGTGGEGHARLNLATSPEILTEAVRRMAASM